MSTSWAVSYVMMRIWDLRVSSSISVEKHRLINQRKRIATLFLALDLDAILPLFRVSIYIDSACPAIVASMYT